jgi:hypothetical protein
MQAGSTTSILARCSGMGSSAKAVVGTGGPACSCFDQRTLVNLTFAFIEGIPKKRGIIKQASQ